MEIFLNKMTGLGKVVDISFFHEIKKKHEKDERNTL